MNLLSKPCQHVIINPNGDARFSCPNWVNGTLFSLAQIGHGVTAIYFLNATNQTPPSLPLARGGDESVASIYQIGITANLFHKSLSITGY
jgi:hypothetical protein